MLMSSDVMMFIQEDLFKEARSEILDQVINLSQIPAQHW